MVYATCLRILGNSAEAEEIAQDCFLRLLEAGTPVHTSLAGWLHSLATSRSLDRIRSASRRRARESRYMAEASDAAAPEWDDIRPLVDEAISTLPQKLRDPVVAHFLEGLTHQAIAERSDIPRATITRQIQRGVESVRKNLKRKGVPVTATGLAAMVTANSAQAAPATLLSELGKVALAGPPAQAAAAALTTKVILGVVLMKKSLAGVALVVALIAAWTLWPSAPTPPADVDTTAKQKETPSAPLEETEPVTPAANARIETETPRVAAAIPAIESAALPESLPPKAELEHGEIADPKDYPTMSGFVRDDAGAPLPGADVTAVLIGYSQQELTNANDESAIQKLIFDQRHHAHAVTDEEGAFSISGIKFEGLALVRAHKAGYGQLPQNVVFVTLEAGNPLADVLVTLSPGFPFRARLLTHDGAPVTDAVIFDTTTGNIAQTDPDGIFEFGYSNDTFREGREPLVQLMVRSTSYGPATFQDVAVLTDDLVTLRMPAPASLSGHILQADGSPATGLEVHTQSVWPDGLDTDTPEYRAPVDAEGAYRINSMEAELLYRVRVVTETGTPRSKQYDLGVFDPGAAVEWNHTLRPETMIHGVLTGDPSGMPLANYFIFCELDGEGVAEATTGTDGTYTLSIMTGKGDYLIYPAPWKPRFTDFPDIYLETQLMPSARTLQLPEGGERELDLSLPDPVTLRARIVEVDGTPIDLTTPGIQTYRYIQVPSTDYNRNGYPLFGNSGGLLEWTRYVPDTEVWFEFNGDGYVSTSTPHVLGRPGEVHDMGDVVAHRSSGVEGTLWDEHGEIIAHAEVHIRVLHEDSRTTWVSRSDATGSFAYLKNIPAVTAALELWVQQPVDDGSKRAFSWDCDPIEFRAGETVDLGTIRLQPEEKE
jgi:RNA polymerase sigma factor (sigma-70 family)